MYIELKEPKLSSVSSPVETHNITEVWVFQDDQIIGLFPLPAKVPIVSENASVKIKISAGIRNNGIKDTPKLYPFIAPIETSIEFVPSETKIIPLQFTYKTQGVNMPINDNFESRHSFETDLDGNFATFLSLSTNFAASGLRSGEVKLTEDVNFVEIGSNLDIKKQDINSGASYVEFDYKGEGEISIGVAKINNSIFKVDRLIYVPCKQEWNHIYIDFTTVLQPKDFDAYRIVFGFTKAGNSNLSNVYIDNVKHLHF
jgi:hypothetical protein